MSNNRRLFGPIGYISPAEAEADKYSGLKTPIWSHDSNQTAPRKLGTLQTFKVFPRGGRSSAVRTQYAPIAFSDLILAEEAGGKLVDRRDSVGTLRSQTIVESRSIVVQRQS